MTASTGFCQLKLASVFTTDGAAEIDFFHDHIFRALTQAFCVMLRKPTRKCVNSVKYTKINQKSTIRMCSVLHKLLFNHVGDPSSQFSVRLCHKKAFFTRRVKIQNFYTYLLSYVSREIPHKNEKFYCSDQRWDIRCSYYFQFVSEIIIMV